MKCALTNFSGFKNPVLNFLNVYWVLLPYKQLLMSKTCIDFSEFCLHSKGTEIEGVKGGHHDFGP